MNRAERVLVLLMRVGGALILLAIVAVVMPSSWMAATHRWLGLGAYPEAPLTEYLARSASALYAIHGGLLLLLSRDVRRYSDVIAYLAITGLLFGVTVIAIDLYAGMPTYWVLGEGPSILVTSLVFLALLRAAVATPESG